MLKLIFPLMLAAGAGVSIVVQQALNAKVRGALDSAAWAGFASYLVGLACMAVFVVMLREPWPTPAAMARIPWWAWSGGLFGAIFIGLSVELVPIIGAATFIALLVAGQMAASVVFDHYGLLGLAQRPIDLPRVIGVCLLIAGVALIRR